MARVNLGRMLQDHVVDRPLFTTPARAARLMGIVARELGYGRGQMVRAYHDDGDGNGDGPVMLADLAASSPRLSGPRDDRKVFRVVDGVAVIPVEGDLVHKLGTLDPWCGMTGYDAIAYKLGEAVLDPDVRGIMLDVNSPGGEVDGCVACGDAILKARKVKPVWAALSDNAFSAAFWLASQAGRVIIPRTGGIGSVGVVTLHADWSRALDEGGLTITVIHAGAHKADGHPYAPLPEAVLADITGELEALRRQFAGAVAAGRGIEIDAVLATEARCFLAEEGISTGFADEILNPDDALSAFVEHLATDVAGRTISTPAALAAIPANEGEDMALNSNAAAGGGDRAKGGPVARGGSARPQATAKPKASDDVDDDDKGNKESAAEGGEAVCDSCPHNAKDRADPPCRDCPDNSEGGEDAKAGGEGGEDDDEDEDKVGGGESAAVAKARIKAILSAPEAKACGALAQHLAFNTDVPVKAAVAAMQASAEDGAGAKGGFASVMKHFAGPDLGVDAPGVKAASGLSAAVDREMARLNLSKS